jgi:hypothetical protein
MFLKFGIGDFYGMHEDVYVFFSRIRRLCGPTRHFISKTQESLDYV